MNKWMVRMMLLVLFVMVAASCKGGHKVDKKYETVYKADGQGSLEKKVHAYYLSTDKELIQYSVYTTDRQDGNTYNPVVPMNEAFLYTSFGINKPMKVKVRWKIECEFGKISYFEIATDKLTPDGLIEPGNYYMWFNPNELEPGNYSMTIQIKTYPGRKIQKGHCKFVVRKGDK